MSVDWTKRVPTLTSKNLMDCWSVVSDALIWELHKNDGNPFIGCSSCDQPAVYRVLDEKHELSGSGSEYLFYCPQCLAADIEELGHD